MEEIKEEWRDIEGYENLYQVSNLGRVKSLKFGKEKILKLKKTWDGYCIVGLCQQNKRKDYLVHRLVAQTFIDNPQNLPQVNHRDENPLNNDVQNLEWCTPKQNINYGTHNQRSAASRINHPKRSKQVLCVETGKIYPSASEVERHLGFSQGNISSACRGKLKTAYRFHWRYVE